MAKTVAPLVRIAIEHLRRDDEVCLKLSTALVAIGVFLEFFEIRHELREKAGPFKIHRPELPVWMLKAGFAGWLMIVGGVVGEFVFESAVSTWNEELDSLSNALLGDAQLSAAQANKEAGSAASSANAAKDALKQVNGRVASLNGQLDATEKAAAQLKSQLQQRHLSEKQSDALIKALKDSPSGGNAAVGTMPLDGEAKIYAQDFHDVLLQAGPKWNRDERWRGVIIVDNFELPGAPPFDPWGITIRCRSDATCKAGQELASAFKKAGFKEPPVVDLLSKYDCAIILIGRQPTVDFDKRKSVTIRGNKRIVNH